MKKLSLLTALLVGASLTVFTSNAQQAADSKPGKRPGQNIEQQMKRLSKSLELTETQKPKVKALLEETTKKRQELLADTSTPPRERRTKMTSLVQEQDKKLKAILTADQFTKFEKDREEMRNKAKEKAPGKAPGQKKERKRDL